MIRRHLTTTFFALAALLLSTTATAATITVNNTTDDIANTTDCTLRDAVIAANNDLAVDGCAKGDGADTIILPQGYTSFQQGQITVDTDVTIQGAGAELTLLDGQGDSRAFEVLAAGSLALHGIKLNNFKVTAGYGGAVLVHGTLAAEDCRFQSNHNTESNGGAVTLDSGSNGIFTRCEFVTNTAADHGGAVEVFEGTGAFFDCLFQYNSAEGSGGAIVHDGVPLEIEGCLFRLNEAAASGGAIWNLSPVDIINSTFHENVAAIEGGAIEGGDAVKLSHVTITENLALSAGGGVDVPSGSLQIVNSIVASNTALTGPDCTNGTAPALNVNNLVGDPDGCEGVAGPGATPLDPYLGGLVDNGGPTLSLAVLPISPAFGAGDCIDVDGDLVAVDQRGFPRYETTCTIGAYEYLPPAGTLVEITDEAAGDNCEKGGVKIEVGTDSDYSGTLDADEVGATHYVCDGSDGTAGEQGEQGEPGANGMGGSDALQPVMEVTPEPEGENCPEGGALFEVGLDQDGDGTLDEDEVTSQQYICAGEAGPQGEQGNPGEDGAQGPQGQQGPEGEPGLERENGAVGPVGSAGSCTASATPISCGIPLLLLVLGLALRRLRLFA